MPDPKPTGWEPDLILADRWRKVCKAYGWNPDATTAETIIARFDQLGEAKERKEAVNDRRRLHNRDVTGPKETRDG